MTEAGSTPSSQGLFRTPLACAMLTGALEVGRYELWTRHPLNSAGRVPSPMDWFLIYLPVYAAMAVVPLLGPLLCKRSWAILFKTICAAVVYGLCLIVRYYVAVLWFKVATFRSNQLVYIEFAVISQSALTGLLLAWLYGTKTKLYSSLLGALASIPCLVLFHWVLPDRLWDSGDFSAFGWLLDSLSMIAVVVLPTIPIDRALRTDALKQVVEHE